MKPNLIKVLLSQRTRRRVDTEAASYGTTPDQLVAKIVTDHYDAVDAAADAPSPAPVATPAADFRVERAFPKSKYPTESFKLTQALIDEAVKLGDVTVRQQGRAIVFLPRILRIDYVLSNRAERPGFVVNFYGALGQFNDPDGVLKTGPKSYVHARVTSEKLLEYVRPFVRQAYTNRFGNQTP